MDNQLDVPLGILKLPVPLKEDYNRRQKLIELIEKPLWTITGKCAKDTLIPDLVSICKVNDQHQFIIFDAKYYNAHLEKGIVPTGQPGIESITKQYLYQLAYQQFIEDHNFSSVKNCFLLPTENNEIEDKGEVRMEMLSNLGLQDIKIRLIPATMAYDLYLSGSKMDMEIECYSAGVTKYLNAFNMIKQTTVLPLLFRVFDDYEARNIDENTLCSVLECLLTYFVRTNACEINKNMAKFMKSLYDRVIDGNYEHYYERFVMFLNDIRANDRMPTDKEFREALIYRPLYKKNICKYLLSVIENSTKEHIDVSNLTIEHILPQKENAAVWKKEVGADYGRVYETYLHTLGNLTITGHNSELGTKAFEEKKKIIRQNSKANILNREVLSADTWTEKSILHRAEILADILIEEFKYIEIHSDTNESTELTFDVNSNFDFSNTKPGEMIFVGEHTKVSSWADLLAKTMNTAFDLDAETITDLATKDYSIPYATRIYISNDERKIRKPKQIDNSGIYFEANLSANGIISFIKDLLAKLQLDTDDFSFSLSEVPFDIDNEDTWVEGLIPVAKLFYNFVENLVEKGLIDSAELENLKTKEYTKNLFQATDYPAIANSRTDNMGNSLQKRYRAKAINFNGTDIYVSTQFFDSDRDAVIDWYRSHL